MYGVSFDEDLDAIRGFAAQLAVGFPVLWDRGGERWRRRCPSSDSRPRCSWTGAVPSGKVHLGYDTREGERLEAEVRELLAEPAPAVSATR